MKKTRSDGIKTLDDIKDRCRVDEITGCWLWAGAKDIGAARVWMPGIGAVSLTMALQVVMYGTRPTGKRMLVPRCNNTLCGNPEHRKWGTRSELFAGMRPTLSPQHRASMTSAKRAKSAVCSEEIAAAIRASTEPASVVADRLGMHLTHVCRIRRGEAWATGLAQSSIFRMGAAA